MTLSAPAPAIAKTTGLLRHRCRNPRCGAQLKDPVDNSRAAFCCSGCFESYFRNRCLVCERPFKRKRKAEHQRFCRPRCQKEFRRHPERFLGVRYQTSVLSVATFKTPIKSGLKIGTLGGQPFRMVAGPVLTPIGLRLASLPLDPGFVARLERVHAPYLEARRRAKRAAARRALIKRHHSPVNILGGYRFPNAPAIDLIPPPATDWAVPSRWIPTTGAGADVPDVPDFLRRTPALLQRRAA